MGDGSWTPSVVVCACGVTFTQKRRNQRFCSAECRYEQRALARDAERAKRCVDCGAALDRPRMPGRPPIRCGSCLESARRIVREGRREQVRRGRMQERRSVRLKLWEAHGGACQVCGNAIDPSRPQDDPWALEVDHRMPRAAGGSDDWSNLQPVHRRCNQEKGAKVSDVLLRGTA